MTQHYIATKIVQAWPQEKVSTAGYAIKYPDGYTSWCPKEEFEKHNIPLGILDNLPEFHQRLIGELAELKDRKVKLLAALQNPIIADTVGTRMFSLMEEQWETMHHLQVILEARLELLSSR